MSNGFAKTWAMCLSVLVVASSAHGATRGLPAVADSGRVSSVEPFRQPAPLPAFQGPGTPNATPSPASESPHQDSGVPSKTGVPSKKGEVIGRKGSGHSPAVTSATAAAALAKAQNQRILEAQNRVKKLQQDLNVERNRATIRKNRIDRLQGDLGHAEQALKKAGAAVEASKGEIVETRAMVDSANEKNDDLNSYNLFLQRYSRYMIVGAIVLVALSILLASILLMRAKRRSAALKDDLDRRNQIEQARKNAADWLLIGSKSRLKLRGMLLAGPGRGSIVGRGQSDADVIVDDESVSRRHARFFYRDGNLMVEDLRSLNGTFVNGQRLDSGEIRQTSEHDQISIAKLSYTLRRA
jgi:hypothetical protein